MDPRHLLVVRKVLSRKKCGKRIKFASADVLYSEKCSVIVIDPVKKTTMYYDFFLSNYFLGPTEDKAKIF